MECIIRKLVACNVTIESSKIESVQNDEIWNVTVFGFVTK